MKKRIVLFLAAALVSAGLIMSCGGGGGGSDDDDGPGVTPGTGTGTGDGHYSVTFKVNGGTFDDNTTEDKVVVTVDGTGAMAGKQRITAANWPGDPTKGTDTFVGWYEGATKYEASASTEFTKDTVLTAKWSNPYSGEKLTITVGDSTQDVELTAVKRDVNDTEPDLVAGDGEYPDVVYFADETGFRFSYFFSDPKDDDRYGYGHAFAYFPVDLGEGKTIADYKEVNFKMLGNQGDIGWKHVFLFVWPEDGEPASIDSSNDNDFGQFGDVNFNQSNTTITPGKFDLINHARYDELKAIDTQNIKVAIVFWAANVSGSLATSYSISDIEFVEVGADETVDIFNIPLNVRAPVGGQTAVTSFTTAQYDGAIEWAGTLNDGKFVQGTTYTATITLTAKPGSTFEGVAANAFTVKGATAVTNAANSGVLTATFPTTPAAIPEKVVTFAEDDTTTGFNSKSSTISDVTTTGFTIDQTAGYGPWASFEVEFDSGVTLGDYTKVEFKYTGLTGDMTYKNGLVYAYDGEVDTFDTTGNILEAGGNGAFLLGKTPDSNGAGTSEKTGTVTFWSVDSSIDKQKVNIIINLWSNPVKFKVSDIRFYN